MIVVGLTGGMGQGKSTVGHLLRQLAKVDYRADLESSYPISEVANAWMQTWPKPLKLEAGQTVVELANILIRSFPAVLERLTGKTLTYDQLKIDATNPKSLELHNRLIAYLEQYLGLTETERTVQLPTPIFEENKRLHRPLLQWIGGVTIELGVPTVWSDLLDRRIKQLAERNYVLVTVGGIRYDHDVAMIKANGGVVLRVERPDSLSSSDVTETSMQEIRPDITIVNNGNLEQLELAVNQLWADLLKGEPKIRYEAVFVEKS